MTEPRVIRKYANRRLYDATASRHVTNDDIRRLIAGGERVKVIDDRSGEDLTRTVLLQIIAEQEQFGAPVLSEQRTVQEQIAKTMAGPLAPLAPLAELTRQNMDMWNRVQDSMLAAITPKSKRSAAAPESDGPAAAGAAPENAASTDKPDR